MKPGPSARWLVSFALLACKSAHESAPPPPPPKPPGALQARELPPTLSVPLPSSPPPSSPPPISSEVVAFERQLQASKLRPPPHRARAAHLAFGRGVLAQLGANDWRIFELGAAGTEPKLLMREPVEAPRSLLALSDGSILAVTTRRLLRWEPSWKHPKALTRPALLPGDQLFADALRGDVIWRFQPHSGAAPGTLSSYLLASSELAVLLPEQTIELAAAGDAMLGITREGVWLSLGAGHGERFAPAGERLPGLELGSARLPTWALPALRLDQSLWVHESGEVERVQVSPSFSKLSRAKLAGQVFAADVGDQGRLLAVVVITGEGPRFELQLLDAELSETGRVVLAAEPPSGGDDWVQVVTRNQELVVNPQTAQVAVGGPERATIFDAAGKAIFSIPSR